MFQRQREQYERRVKEASAGRRDASARAPDVWDAPSARLGAAPKQGVVVRKKSDTSGQPIHGRGEGNSDGQTHEVATADTQQTKRRKVVQEGDNHSSALGSPVDPHVSPDANPLAELLQYNDGDRDEDAVEEE